MMRRNCELKQVLVWASSCNMNSQLNQLFPNHIHSIISTAQQNRIHSFNLILQPFKLQELCDNLMVRKDSYYMLNYKEPVRLIFNSEDKKQNISKSLFFLGTRLNKVR